MTLRRRSLRLIQPPSRSASDCDGLRPVTSDLVNRRRLLGSALLATFFTSFAFPRPAAAQQFTRVIVTLRNADRDREVQDLFNALTGLEYRLIEAYPDRPVLILDVSERAMRRLRGLPMVAQVASDGITPFPKGETPGQNGISPLPKGETPQPRPPQPNPFERPPAPRPGAGLQRYIVQYSGGARREIRRIRRAMDGLPFRITRQMDASRMIVVETNARGYRRLQRIEGVRVWRDGVSAPL